MAKKRPEGKTQTLVIHDVPVEVIDGIRRVAADTKESLEQVARDALIDFHEHQQVVVDTIAEVREERRHQRPRTSKALQPERFKRTIRGG